MDNKIKVLLADDHQIVLDGILLMLEEEPSLILSGMVNDGEQVLEHLAVNEVDILITDINMPKLNGIDLTKKVRQAYPNIKIIGLSMMNEIKLVQKLFANGANGFLLKNTNKEEFIQALKIVAEGGKYYDKNILADLLEPTKANKTSLFPKLSRREKEILKLIVNERTTKEIADELFISFGTVETHRRNIINKLGVRNTAGLVRVAIEYGLVED